VRVRVPEAARLLPGDERAGRHVDQRRQRRVQQRDLDTPPAAALERGEDRDGRMHAGHDVHDGDSHLRRLVVARDRHQP
jgi:hypothetical protein